MLPGWRVRDGRPAVRCAGGDRLVGTAVAVPAVTGPAGIAVGVLLLIAVLAWAVIRPRGWSEAVLAVPAAGLALALGLVSGAEAGRTLGEFGPTLAFLAAVLVLAGMADAEGVFRWLGSIIARSGRTPARLLAVVFAVASATTAVLSLDATVVLLTPAVISAVRWARVRPEPAMYATAHLSNTASLLLPVSNLTNLLAFHMTGLTFLEFAGHMALPFVVCVGLEYLVFRVFFAAELRPDALRRRAISDTAGHAGPGEALAGNPPAGSPQAGNRRPEDPSPGDPRPGDGRRDISPPRRALAILAAVLIGFALAPLAGVPSYVVALVGAAVLATVTVGGGRAGVRQLVAAASPAFLLFVAALLIVVDGAVGGGPDAWLAARLPGDTSLVSLLVLAGVGAGLACVINNLPATLVLLAALGPHPTAGVVLAMLIGVNVGPNLAYTGSLALLLWRRVLHRQAVAPSLGRFTALGAVSVPLCLAAGTAALWLVL